MRFVKPLLLVAGAVLLGVLVYRIGATPILESLRQLAWWQFVLVCLPYGLTTALDTLGWRYAFARDRVPFWRLFGARMAGEALNLVTALGSVGGEAVKAWLVRRDVTYDESIPSIVIAKTTIVMAQALFVLIGVAVAWAVVPLDAWLVRAMVWVFAVQVLAVAGFVLAQVSGLVARGGGLLVRAGLIQDASHARTLDQALRHYYRHEWRRLALSVGYHLLGWLLSALEALVVLWALGVGVAPLVATVVEAVGAGTRFATFMVPASLGALEGANAAAFTALGLAAAAGLAFSLVRRARQAVWIVAGILVLVAMRWRAGSAPAASARPAA